MKPRLRRGGEQRYHPPVPALCNVEGRLVPPEQAVVPVLDRGFLYGDSVYEVVRTYGGRPFEMERHLRRMERTAGRTGLFLPPRGHPPSPPSRPLGRAPHAPSYARLLATPAPGASRPGG